ncbi:MAG: bifunctional phosphopantothenoylcysteine decarboxylase/phosphopantothenate--cysteine ligase CoaBC [Cytophagales bacterium]|nr:bifunctional phosphopantothenoylcysteine decarboxylase/phosphopantothenate--cysteine ligase CoaBC [Cytophagales bacterium]
MLIGITGCIASYKILHLIRLLVKAGAEVQVLTTQEALRFLSPLTLSTLSLRPVLSTLETEGRWNNHVDLANWADVFIIAPATANTLAKMVTGQSDNLILTSYLSARCPIVFAPAMDRDMYLHVRTQENIDLLKKRALHIFIPPVSGSLASGLEGMGRLPEPEDLFLDLKKALSPKPFLGKTVLLNSGPTYEFIDEVRFIGNSSSGRMGHALAQALVEQGAAVHLVSGPSHLPNPRGVKTQLEVKSADEMWAACAKIHPHTDFSIFCAAVSDYKPKVPQQGKVKKQSSPLSIHMIPNPDIAHALGKEKKKHQIHVGFALEDKTNLEEAERKRKYKNFDMIVLNTLKEKEGGFGSPKNKITLLKAKTKPIPFPLKTKEEIAYDILEHLQSLLPT